MLTGASRLAERVRQGNVFRQLGLLPLVSPGLRAIGGLACLISVAFLRWRG